MGKVSKIGGGPIGGESWIVPSGMVLRFPDGSASSPSLTFTVDTNTGLYRIGSDNIGVSTGGTLRFDVSTTAVTSTLAIVLPVGAVGTPSLTFTGDTTSGLYRIGANNVGVALNGALEYDLSTTVLNLKGNALSGDSASGGVLTLQSTSHTTKGTISVGRLTLSDLANADGIVFGNLGTATKGIDFSASGLSGATDYWIYINSTNCWGADGSLSETYVYAQGGIYSNIVGNLTSGKDLVISSGGFENISFHSTKDQSSPLFGNSIRVGSLSLCSSNGTATITKTTHGLTLAVGELVHVTGSSTVADKGFYRIVSSTENTIVVDRVLSGTQSDVALTVYKDVISMHATDATNGQILTSWSAQNKPMQIGGTVLAATVTLTSKDLYIGGDIGFSSQTANGSVATAISSVGPTGAQTTIQGWIKIIDSAGTARYLPYW